MKTATTTDERRTEALEELKQIRIEIKKLHETIDALGTVLLNGLLPYGKPTDKWRRDY